MPLTIFLAFIWAPPAAILGDTSRILYFHVPLAWISSLSFLISGISSILYLFVKHPRLSDFEEKSYIAASLGTLFIILTLITGSIWANASWGSYWNWDPRETTILILLVIYIAYFSLRSALADNENKSRICASYLVIASLTVPFFVYIIPRLYPTLHPNEFIDRNNTILFDPKMKITLLVSLIAFTLLYFYLFHLKIRLFMINKKIEERADAK